MDNNFWLFVANNPKHMADAKERSKTWWCVDRRCKIGDKAFLFKTLQGIICYFEILEINDSEYFCRLHGMQTGLIKIIKNFKRPITARVLKSTPILKGERFISRNFQGKSFIIENEESVKAMLSL